MAGIMSTLESGVNCTFLKVHIVRLNFAHTLEKLHQDLIKRQHGSLIVSPQNE
jgi:hypothetical protein